MSNIRYQLSYWEREAFFKEIDFLVVGSGIVGLNAALRLRELAPQARIVIVERGPLPIGASTRNAGFACFGSVSELLEDRQQLGESQLWGLVEQRWQGLQRLRRRVGDEALRYHEWGGFELFRKEDGASLQECTAAIPEFNRRLQQITGKNDVYRRADDRINEFGLQGVQGLIHNGAEGQIHTGYMMKALLRQVQKAGIDCYAGLGIRQIRDETGAPLQLVTEQGWTIEPGQAIVATNGFATQLLPGLPVSPGRNQVLLTEPVPGLRLKGCFHYDRGYVYFRNIDGRVLLGGGRNLDETGETTAEFGTHPAIRRSLLQLLQTIILPGQKIDVAQWWTGILGLGGQKAPIVQAVGPRSVVAARLGGMGVAIGSLIGEQAADLLAGQG